jgi:hypothetical protein
MLPLVFRTKKRIFKYYTGFSFFIFIWISNHERDQPRLIRHERIHFYQQVELLFIFHWLLYVTFYSILRLKGQRHYIAYRFNPFELEAYENDNDLTYGEKRKLFSWVRYLKKYKEISGKDMSAQVPPHKEIGW